MTSQYFDMGQQIVTEGDTGELFYIIKEGVVSCSQGSKEVRRLSKGDYFGEQALLYGGKRTATVTAVDKPVECVCIRRGELEQALGSHLQQVIYRNTQRMALERCHTLKRLSKEQTERLISHMRVSSYSNGQVVIPQGQAKDAKLWIVLKGALGPNRVKVVAERLECLGAQSEGVFGETLVAIGEQVHIAEIDRDGLQHCLEGEMPQAATEALAALKHVPLLKGLGAERLSALARLLRTEDFKDETVIVKQGSPGDTFYIVKSGKVEVTKDGVAVRTISRLDYFGERSVLQEEVRTASVVARGTASCWVLHRDDLLSVINDHVRSSLLKRMELQDDSVSLTNLAAVRLLGKGTYGHVYLVSRLPRGPLYAMKTISRRKVESMGLETNVQLERRLMLQLDHPFMTSLIRTFKDSKRLYFLLEYVDGPDLFDVLRILGLLTDPAARFYTAAVLLMLEHLHEHSIIYRDLKPENLMIDSEGYPKLIDFGTAKSLNGRTYTITGTPHYMAPEVILGKGYGLPVDLWSLGIMLYEFVCGGLPFGEEEEDPYAIYEKVLQHRLVFARGELPSRSLIEQLLNTNPVLRFSGGMEKLKAHSWFSGLSWVSSTLGSAA
jgi:cGMP-dependent protein kinase